jgi:hypothetical protein
MPSLNLIAVKLFDRIEAEICDPSLFRTYWLEAAK